MSMTPLQAQSLGALIAKARVVKGVSVRALAEQLGLNFSWLSKLEAGRYADPSPERLTRLAEALEIEPARIDRITKGSVAASLPGMRTYFRAKYGLTPDEADRVARYVQRLRRQP